MFYCYFFYYFYFSILCTRVKVRRIWKEAPCAAFTSLVFYEGNFYCAFREANTHVDKMAMIMDVSALFGQK